MSSDAAVSPPTRIPHPLTWCNLENSFGCDKLCYLLGNAVVECEMRDVRVDGDNDER